MFHLSMSMSIFHVAIPYELNLNPTYDDLFPTYDDLFENVVWNMCSMLRWEFSHKYYIYIEPFFRIFSVLQP